MRGVALLLSSCVPAGLSGFVVVVDGSVTDADGAPLAAAEVTVLGDTGEVLGTATTDAEGAWSFPLYSAADRGNSLHATATAEGLSGGAGDWDVNLLSAETATLRARPVQDWEAVHRPLAPFRLDDDGTSVSGRIVDPSGSPVEGLHGSLQPGWNAPVGAAASASFTTDRDGEFSASVGTPGLYTAYVAPTGGWAGARFPLFTDTSASPVAATIAPLQAPGQLLATVMWAGATDLDLHLTAPLRESEARTSSDRFHVWADEPVHPERVDDPDDYVAQLVRSAASGPGPEVIVVNTPPGAGELHLSVVDRSHESEADSGVLAETGALVQWWNGEDIPRYAWVSPLELANAWRPVEIDTRDATVFCVESYTSAVLSSDAGSF